jgi:hypothetical protein
MSDPVLDDTLQVFLQAELGHDHNGELVKGALVHASFPC